MPGSGLPAGGRPLPVGPGTGGCFSRLAGQPTELWLPAQRGGNAETGTSPDATLHAFYNARRHNLAEGDILPNPAHLALARLEREWPGEVLVVTQNIDDLHERAGTRNLIHMHGELLKIRCAKCARPFAWAQDLSTADKCPDCYRTGTLRPHVVWFGEVPLEMERIIEALADCSLFVSIGTSGHVYPAAGFVQTVQAQGRAHTIELNLEPSEGASMFAESRLGPASD